MSFINLYMRVSVAKIVVEISFVSFSSYLYY